MGFLRFNYNKLKTESKHLQNIIKIICYRAETAIANLLSCYYRKRSDEIRALVKSIILQRLTCIRIIKQILLQLD